MLVAVLGAFEVDARAESMRTSFLKSHIKDGGTFTKMGLISTRSEDETGYYVYISR